VRRLCGHGNGPLGSIKGRECLDETERLTAPKEGFCSVDLVNQLYSRTSI
jgi:hypothetical protein